MEDTTAALYRWRAETYGEGRRKMDISFLLSEQWHEAVNELWSTYSGLESQRQNAGAPRMSWQDSYETEHKENMQLRKEFFKPHPERLQHLCPLWAALARYQGEVEPYDDRRLNGWRSLLDDWDKTNELMENDRNFRNSLSATQQRSYHLLTRWWTAAYCDAELLDATKTYLESQRPVNTFSDPSTNDRLAHIAKDVQTDKSMYHAKLLRLFLMELHPMWWEPNVWRAILVPLQTARYESSYVATIQQMSYAVVHPSSTRQVSYPVVFRNDDTQRVASARTCDNPYYLWDTELDKTVVVEEMAKCPDYVCISHTWGRWRTRTETSVPGVPWLVPENTVWDVKSLPEQLHRIGHRYIWLDLFCIPQDRSLLGKKEIANQASIFRGSSHCIAWINDVNSWGSVLEALDWIGLNMWAVISAGGKELIQDRLPGATSSASMPVELMKRTTDNQLGPSEPANWFSSLWTLQECALCPDIELYNCTWERLEDRCGTPISLRTLMVLAAQTEDFLKQSIDLVGRHWPGRREALAKIHDGEYPLAVQDIYDLCALTRLDEVLTDGSPVPVLIHSNKRQCTSRRAPAIMSAIGVTDWYMRSIISKTQEPLLFNHYPISFVREAATKLGAQFYCHAGGLYRPGKISKFFPGTSRAEFEGSMLPFVKLQGWFGNTNMLYNDAFIDAKDHEAVSTWTINEDGRVTIRSAGVCMTSDDEPTTKHVSGIVSCIPVTEGGKKKWTYSDAHATKDMLTTLKSMTYGSRCIYAVALYEDCCILHGILLEHLPISMFHNKQYLIKVGTFIMKQVSLPPLEEVRWEVL